VLSAADAIDGAMPLVHAAVTVVKLHGDYLDSRLRNTESDWLLLRLGLYGGSLDEFLKEKKEFDQFSYRLGA
jgi:hypothetical protein